MVFLFSILNYIVGSIPFALVIGKLFYNTDVRNYGSGNLGATNTGRVLGKKAAAVVAVLDALKGFFMYVFESLVNPSAAVLAVSFVAVGHCYPLFANFKGGKAVATTFGIMLAVSISSVKNLLFIFIIPLALWFAISKATQYISLASIIALFVSFVLSFVAKANLNVSIALLILWLLVVFRHKENIKRLLNGTENKKNY